MKRTYSCPHCDAVLNPNVKIILRAELGKQRGLFLFSAQPGNYDVMVPEGFKLKKRDEVTFSCPVCSHDLRSEHDAKMAEIHAAGDGKENTVVAFSRAYGEHATYFITREHVKAYGEHARPDVNYWGEGGD